MARTLTPVLLLWCALLTPSLKAQDHPDPRPRPDPRPIAPNPAAAPPREDSIPGLEDADFRIGPAPLRREGSFITRQRGSMVRLPSGDRAFIFHKDAQGRAERPMVLLPCLTLQSMEQILSDRNEETAFLITGQVYAYRGVNYLLPTAAPTASIPQPESPATPQPTPSAPQPSSTQPSSTQPDAAQPGATSPAERATDPAVHDLIRDLEAQRDRPRTLGSPAPAPKIESTTDLLPEGSTISLRRGRIVRLNSGDWAFAFDNAPSGDPTSDRALILSPCLNLQRLEGWAQQLGDGATLLMSGRIYQYQGRNHIIPTMYQLGAHTGELSPR